MKLVRLGGSELKVSPVCYGSWQLSPKFWGPQPKDVLIKAMRRAYEVGINFYDTADAYGDGLSESVMGEALSGIPRDKIVVATKVFNRFYPDGHRHPYGLTHRHPPTDGGPGDLRTSGVPGGLVCGGAEQSDLSGLRP